MFAYSSVKVRMILKKTLLNSVLKKNGLKILFYRVSSSYGNVRVRFAPSPTGICVHNIFNVMQNKNSAGISL